MLPPLPARLSLFRLKTVLHHWLFLRLQTLLPKELGNLNPLLLPHWPPLRGSFRNIPELGLEEAGYPDLATAQHDLNQFRQ